MQTLAIRLHPYAVIFGAIILNECYAELEFDNWRFVFTVSSRSEITESQNGLGWTGPQGSPAPTPRHRQGHQPPDVVLDQAAQGPSFEN